MRLDPPTILKRIIDYKRAFVSECKRCVQHSELLKITEKAPVSRDFASALRVEGRVSVIAEIKKASPSKGLIRQDFDPVAIARAYETHGAAAVSCLTDEKFFQGSLKIFRSVRAATGLPMLRKEFIIDEYQIDEARAAGADAVLLITSILTDEELKRLRERIEHWGMTALVEVHSAGEARRAVDSGATVIGVNNRDLDSADFHTDIRQTEIILPLLPKEAVRVSESGIRTTEDVAYLQGLGVDAILVGEHLMRQANPGAALGEMQNAERRVQN